MQKTPDPFPPYGTPPPYTGPSRPPVQSPITPPGLPGPNQR